jgi:hypothetical protein
MTLGSWLIDHMLVNPWVFKKKLRLDGTIDKYKTRRHQGYYILFIDVYLRSREQVSRTVILSDHASGEGE